MLQKSILDKAYVFLIMVVLGLAILALTAEILPEMEAKLIVIPTLIIVILLCSYDLISWARSNRTG